MYEKLCLLILVVCAVKGMPEKMLKHIKFTQELESCYADNDNFYPFTGVKTAYDFVHDNIAKRIVLQSEYVCRNFSTLSIKKESFIVQFWLIANTYFRLQTAADLDDGQTWHALPEWERNQSDVEFDALSRFSDQQSWKSERWVKKCVSGILES